MSKFPTYLVSKTFYATEKNNYSKNKKDSDSQSGNTSPFFGITFNPGRW